MAVLTPVGWFDGGWHTNRVWMPAAFTVSRLLAAFLILCVKLTSRTVGRGPALKNMGEIHLKQEDGNKVGGATHPLEGPASPSLVASRPGIHLHLVSKK